jgi:putative Mn2+ efflux pump MntP
MGRELMRLGSSAVPYEEEDSSSSESHINSIKASIAARFNVSLDSVDVVSTVDNSELKIQYATVFLSSVDVGRITKT